MIAARIANLHHTGVYVTSARIPQNDSPDVYDHQILHLPQLWTLHQVTSRDEVHHLLMNN